MKDRIFNYMFQSYSAPTPEPLAIATAAAWMTSGMMDESTLFDDAAEAYGMGHDSWVREVLAPLAVEAATCGSVLESLGYTAEGKLSTVDNYIEFAVYEEFGEMLAKDVIAHRGDAHFGRLVFLLRNICVDLVMTLPVRHRLPMHLLTKEDLLEHRPWTAKEAMHLTLNLVRGGSAFMAPEMVEKMLEITDPAISSLLQRAVADTRYSFKFYPVSRSLHVRANGWQVARVNVDTLEWVLTKEGETPA